ncbi:hypothetical protein PYCCODRAFT_43427 [Trametes coccinea BRFM310]|uniref:Uncharacterized protein n=1 Tax=Trametes coccinea (strain BRFM310) TaxID=1353009 RepID=A0A1Y2J5H6_TRAC3|nr:hypothetical protein PYCCODRAFT_43427 [Trametes coccinea BRFM310]
MLDVHALVDAIVCNYHTCLPNGRSTVILILCPVILRMPRRLCGISRCYLYPAVSVRRLSSAALHAAQQEDLLSRGERRVSPEVPTPTTIWHASAVHPLRSSTPPPAAGKGLSVCPTRNALLVRSPSTANPLRCVQQGCARASSSGVRRG